MEDPIEATTQNVDIDDTTFLEGIRALIRAQERMQEASRLSLLRMQPVVDRLEKQRALASLPADASLRDWN